MSEHRHPQDRVSNDVHPDNPVSCSGADPGTAAAAPTGSGGDDLNAVANAFNPADALESLHLEVVQLEALANAASEAVIQLPFPSDREERRAFERAYALSTKTADDANAIVTYGNELIAALAIYLKGRRASR